MPDRHDAVHPGCVSVWQVAGGLSGNLPVGAGHAEVGQNQQKYRRAQMTPNEYLTKKAGIASAIRTLLEGETGTTPSVDLCLRHTKGLMHIADGQEADGLFICNGLGDSIATRTSAQIKADVTGMLDEHERKMQAHEVVTVKAAQDAAELVANRAVKAAEDVVKKTTAAAQKGKSVDIGVAPLRFRVTGYDWADVVAMLAIVIVAVLAFTGKLSLRIGGSGRPDAMRTGLLTPDTGGSVGMAGPIVGMDGSTGRP